MWKTFSRAKCAAVIFRLLVWLLSTVFVPFTLPRHDRIYDTSSCFGGCQLSYFRPTRNLFTSFNAINTSIAGKFALDLHKFYFHFPGMFWRRLPKEKERATVEKRFENVLVQKTIPLSCQKLYRFLQRFTKENFWLSHPMKGEKIEFKSNNKLQQSGSLCNKRTEVIQFQCIENASMN